MFEFFFFNFQSIWKSSMAKILSSIVLKLAKRVIESVPKSISNVKHNFFLQNGVKVKME